LKRLLLNYLWLFLIAGIIIAADQATKYWVRANVLSGTVYLPDFWLTPYARIVNWHNTGAAFGIFQNMNTFFMIFSFIVSGLIIYYYPQVPSKEWIIRVAMWLLLAGAVGNLIDRIHQGYVTDFISLGPLPVFNIADLSISTGVVVLFFGMWIQERARSAAQQQAALAASPVDPVEGSVLDAPGTPPEDSQGE
jgi:signal peptidase II